MNLQSHTGTAQIRHGFRLGQLRYTSRNVAAGSRLHPQDFAITHGEQIKHPEQVLPNPRIRIPLFDYRHAVAEFAQMLKAALRRAHSFTRGFFEKNAKSPFFSRKIEFVDFFEEMTRGYTPASGGDTPPGIENPCATQGSAFPPKKLGAENGIDPLPRGEIAASGE